MNNVIAFPSRAVRNQAEIKRAIRSLLETNGVDDDYIVAILGNMDEFIRLIDLQFDLTFPAALAGVVDDQLSQFTTALQERMDHLIFERLTMEVENLACAQAR